MSANPPNRLRAPHTIVRVRTTRGMVNDHRGYEVYRTVDDVRMVDIYAVRIVKERILVDLVVRRELHALYASHHELGMRQQHVYKPVTVVDTELDAPMLARLLTAAELRAVRAFVRNVCCTPSQWGTFERRLRTRSTDRFNDRLLRYSTADHSLEELERHDLADAFEQALIARDQQAFVDGHLWAQYKPDREHRSFRHLRRRSHETRAIKNGMGETIGTVPRFYGKMGRRNDPRVSGNPLEL